MMLKQIAVNDQVAFQQYLSPLSRPSHTRFCLFFFPFTSISVYACAVPYQSEAEAALCEIFLCGILGGGGGLC